MAQVERERSSPGLTDSEVQILMFERQWWRYEGSKDKAIRDLFQMEPVRYYQALGALIDREAALAFDPRLVLRLRRGRDERLGARSARRLIPPVSGPSADKL
ncbi:MAG: DUF3263 domain-containing protein [Bifidobacteriaceae bacterium]|jgi:hypothetical protein|nr:DUF3263 domain-containing protein [Bifidobacteriaceae bacterium]